MSRPAAALREQRERTLLLVAGLDDRDLEAVHDPLMSPLAWDLGHIAAYEDLWTRHRLGGRPLLREDLAVLYDAFETPRPVRAGLDFLRGDQLREYMAAVRAEALELLAGGGAAGAGELVLRHEMQHTETMLQTLCLARIAGYRAPAAVSAPEAPGGHSGLEMVDVPAGPFPFGAADEAWSYDNERPQHQAQVPAFRIGRTPVTNATWLSFTEGGGYQRREWWSDEGWAWKEDHDISRPLGWTADGREWRLGDGLVALDPDRVVVHVSWFEADAFARAHDARLPTEAEWEKAATWEHATQRKLRFPWGDEPWEPQRGNLDQRLYATAPAGAYLAGAAPCGALGLLGDVWEWTASPFRGYPGFLAHPYPQYSEVFFGDGYRVLRGGSWATRACVATPTFRNWDRPERRQLFSGLRIAIDG